MTQFIPRALVVLAVAIAMLAISPAFAQTQRQLDHCANKDDSFAPALRIEGCTATIKQAAGTGENLSWAFYNRGIAYAKKGDLDRAIADFDQALRLDPDSTFALNNRGAAYARKGQYSEAIADFNEAIRLDPQSATAYNNRGTAYAKLGEYERALEDFEQAVRLDPKDMGAQNNRRLARQLKGSVAAASPPRTNVGSKPAPDNMQARAQAQSKPLPQTQALALRTAPEAPRANVSAPVVVPPGATNPSAAPVVTPQPTENSTEVGKDRPVPVKDMHAPARGRAKAAAMPKPRGTAMHKAKPRAVVAHAGKSHRSKPSLLARLFRKPLIDFGKVFRVSQRKTYRTSQPAY
jgi:hypothetical protein